MNFQHPKPCYTLDEGLELLGLARTKGYELIANGELHTFKVGRRRFISSRSIDHFITQHEKKGGAA